MNNSSIMIVEDERITALEIQARLEKKGYSVPAIAVSGAQAIEQAQKTHPDLALMDIHLKGNMDGVKAAETLRERFGIPVIYISAYADKKTLERATLTEPFGYILKPIDDRELNATIEMALYKHKTEGELRRAELQYRTVADYAYDWEYWVDPDGNFVYVSPSCERITGYRPEEFMRDPDLLISIAHPDDHELLISHKQKVFKTVGPCSLDFRIIDRFKKVRWIGHCCQAVYSNDGAFLGRRGSNRDITNRKQLEREREILIKSLNEKNVDLESIINIISHDLRVPLATSEGFGNILAEQYKQLKAIIDSDKTLPGIRSELESLLKYDIPESLDFILRSTNILKNLLDSLVRLARLGKSATDLKTLEMNDIIEDIQRGMVYQLKTENINIQIHPLPACLGDKHQIMQVFANLINNAVKFRTPNKECQIEITGRVKDGSSIYCLKDNGIGIAPQYRDKIFDLFYRMENHGDVSGEGMGLNIIKRILGRHDGKIWLESELGKGSKFFVSLPKANL